MEQVGSKFRARKKTKHKPNKKEKKNSMADEYRKLRTNPDGRIVLERKLTYEVDESETLTILQDRLEVETGNVVRAQQEIIKIQALIDSIKALTTR